MTGLKRASRLFLAIALLCTVLATAFAADVSAADKRVSATISSVSVKVGKTVKITAKTKDVTFSSSNSEIAYVSSDGTVSGKKPGTVTITVKKKGYTSKKFIVTVKKNKKLPNVRVACDEIEMSEVIDASGLKIEAKNLASKKATKIVAYYTLQFESRSKEISVTLENVKAGKTKSASYADYTTANVLSYTLNKLEVYAGDGVQTKIIAKDKYSYGYGTEDTKAPVFSGFVGKNSYKKGQVYMTVYAGESFDYTKYVSVEDDRDASVEFTVDDSELEGAQPGTYKVYFTATDAAGNEAKTYAKVNLRKKTTNVDNMADQILSKIIDDSWSDVKKAEAIYKYIRKNYSYVDHSDKSSWTKSAEYGLRYQSGDCFTYYAAARILLTRAGIPNIMIKKVDGYSSGHWWNLVYVKGGWYHFDTTPRKNQAYFCLLTDSQLLSYSRKNGNCHDFNSSLYPDRAKKQIKKLVYGKRY